MHATNMCLFRIIFAGFALFNAFRSETLPDYCWTMTPELARIKYPKPAC